jgi:uncharacterized protein YhdP
MQEKPASVNASPSLAGDTRLPPSGVAGEIAHRISGWRRWSGHGIRVTFWCVLLATILFIAAVAATRFWLIPNADSFRPRIVQELSRVTGQRVVIGGFEAGWNGWSPELKLSRLQMLDTRGRTLLQLPEVQTTISWRSLIFFEPRLTALTIRAPRVVVRRTAENALTVAGIDVDLAHGGEGDPGIVEWLLKQRLVQVSGGEIEWVDEWRKLPPLRLRNVNIRLQNNGSQHRIGMTAVPPTDFAAPLDVRAELVGNDVRKISDWDGLAYVRADYANLGELTRYLPLPVDFSRGDGGLQAWFEFDDGQAVAVTTDMVVRNARMRLPKAGAAAIVKPVASVAVASPAATISSPAPSSAEPLDLASLSGRLSWRSKVIGGSGKDIASQERWSVRDVNAVTQGGVKAPLVTGEVVLDYRGDAITGGSIRLSDLDLGSVGALAKSLPLASDAVQRLQVAQPTGALRNFEAKWRDGGEAKAAGGSRYFFEGGTELVAVGWKGSADVPGVSGLSGSIKGSSVEGLLMLGEDSVSRPLDRARNEERRGTNLALDFGSHFSAPFSFDQLKAKIGWKRTAGSDGAMTTTLDIASAEFQNADATGKFAGTWQTDRLGPGVANITGTLSRAETTAIHRYLPTSLSAGTRNWLRDAVIAGTAQDAAFVLKGPLWHFPFRNDEQGVFEVNAQVTGAILDYADHWPRAENINTRLRFRGSSLLAQVAGATIAGVPIAATEVKIADMGATAPLLDIQGSAVGPMDAFLAWCASSPVDGWLDGFLRNAKATGSGRLNLGLSMPLESMENTRVNGEFVFSGNRVELGGDIPALDNVNGRLRFSERDLRASDIAAEALGGPLKLSIATVDGRIKTQATGTASFDRVRERYAYPLLDQLGGTAQWQLDMTNPARSQAVASSAVVTSAAVGAAATTANAPQGSSLQISATTLQPRWPLDAIFQVNATPRDLAVPIKATLQRVQLDRDRDRLELELPGQLHAILERSAANAAGARIVERATLDVGGQRTSLPTRGYALRGDVMKLDADAAMAVLSPASSSGKRAVGGLTSESNSADFVNINVRATEAIALGQRFNDVILRAQPAGQRWRLALRSKEATGVISLDTDGESGAVDAVSVRLQRLSLPASAPSTTAQTTGTDEAARWPKLDLTADSFVSDGRDLGKLEMRALPGVDEWRIEQVKLTSVDGSIEAKGRWQPRFAGPTVGKTSVDVALKWNDAGKFMTRFGLPKGVERGGGTLNGALSWAGSPAQFSYAKLAGNFTLETSGGRFTEMEPGIAKLLGVLSLQSIPRRLSFNFDDVFGKGFAFDDVKADVTIADGIAKTDGFVISGPSARVQIRGTADINREVQDLQVRVYPSLSTATAIGIGLATANPAIGAAALLGQKLARDPIERFLMQEFEVKGTWANPDVKQQPRIAADSATTVTSAQQ